MYPETDAKPIAVDEKRYEELKQKVPNIEAIKKELEREIGNKQLSEQMLKSAKLQTYKNIVAKTKVNPLLVAAFLLEKMKEMKRNGLEVEKVPEEVIVYVFEKYSQSQITKLGIEEVVKALPKSEVDVEKIIKEKGLLRISGGELKELIKGFGSKEKGFLMKEIMSEYRFNIDGDELNSILK